MTDTTPRGTKYTTVEFTPDGGALSTYGVPTQHLEHGTKTNLLIYCHGSSGDHDDFTRLSVWDEFRNLLIDHGWGYVETIAYDPAWGSAVNNWGSPTGVLHYRRAYEYAAEQINVDHVAILGRSMGGLAAINLFVKDPVISPIAEALILNSATQDLTYRTIGQGAGLGQFRIPYGYPTDQSFIDALPEHDPLQYPVEWWQDRNVLQVVADEDTSVPPEHHGLKLRSRTHHVLALSRLAVAYGGDHGATGGYTQGPAMLRFLNDALYGVARPVQSIYANMNGRIEEVQVPAARMK